MKSDNYVINASLKSEPTYKLINRIPGSHLLILSLPRSALTVHVESLCKPPDLLSILEALPCKLDIKRPSILCVFILLINVNCQLLVVFQNLSACLILCSFELKYEKKFYNLGSWLHMPNAVFLSPAKGRGIKVWRPSFSQCILLSSAITSLGNLWMEFHETYAEYI